VDSFDALSTSSNDTVVHVDTRIDCYVVSLLDCLKMLLLAYIFLSSMTFCYSGFSAQESSIDSVIRVFDVASLDVLSAMFVCVGFTLSHMYFICDRAVFDNRMYEVLIFLYSDIVIAAVAATVFGSLYKIDQQRFRAAEVLITLFEGASALRLFDTHAEGPHSLNVAAWPVLCFLWCCVLAPAGIRGNKYLQSKLGLSAMYASQIFSLVCLLTLNVSAMVHSGSSIFHASATGISYRMLEFNMGVNAAYLLHSKLPLVLCVHQVLHDCGSTLLYAYGCMWWAELGRASPPPPCLRMYADNECIDSGHAFLFKGCMLGIILLCQLQIREQEHIFTVPDVHDVRLLRVLCTAVAFAWPVFALVHFAARILLGDDIVYANSALVSVVMPVLLLYSARAYDTFVKPHMSVLVKQKAQRVYGLCEDRWGQMRARYASAGDGAVELTQQTVGADTSVH